MSQHAYSYCILYSDTVETHTHAKVFSHTSQRKGESDKSFRREPLLSEVVWVRLCHQN